MTSKGRFYLKGSVIEMQSKSKLFPLKPSHHRNNSVSITQSPQNISPKKIYLKAKKKTQSKNSLLNFNPSYLEEIASYGTNDKAKENRENKEKDSMEKILSEIDRKRMTLFGNSSDLTKALFKTKNPKKKLVKGKKWSKSVKKSSNAAVPQNLKLLANNNNVYYFF